MKTSSVLASVLFGAIAAAAPLDKRDLVTKTNVVMETVVIYTTVWDGEVETAAVITTPTPAAFYEVSSSRPRRSRSRGPKPAPTSVYVPPQVTSIAQPSSEAPVSSSVYVAPPVPSTTEEVATPTPEAPAPSSEAPSSTYVAPPVASSTTPEQPASTSTGGGGEVHSGGSMTLNFYGNAVGACGDPVSDTDMAVALAVDVFGDASVDYMTGKTTNKWCNAKVAITYNGKTTNAVIKDRCAGCTNGGFDMTPSLWDAVTGGISGDRITGMTWTLVG